MLPICSHNSLNSFSPDDRYSNLTPQQPPSILPNAEELSESGREAISNFQKKQIKPFLELESLSKLISQLLFTYDFDTSLKITVESMHALTNHPMLSRFTGLLRIMTCPALVNHLFHRRLSTKFQACLDLLEISMRIARNKRDKVAIFHDLIDLSLAILTHHPALRDSSFGSWRSCAYWVSYGLRYGHIGFLKNLCDPANMTLANRRAMRISYADHPVTNAIVAQLKQAGFTSHSILNVSSILPILQQDIIFQKLHQIRPDSITQGFLRYPVKIKVLNREDPCFTDRTVIIRILRTLRNADIRKLNTIHLPGLNCLGSEIRVLEPIHYETFRMIHSRLLDYSEALAQNESFSLGHMLTEKALGYFREELEDQSTCDARLDGSWEETTGVGENLSTRCFASSKWVLNRLPSAFLNTSLYLKLRVFSSLNRHLLTQNPEKTNSLYIEFQDQTSNKRFISDTSICLVSLYVIYKIFRTLKK